MLNILWKLNKEMILIKILLKKDHQKNNYHKQNKNCIQKIMKKLLKVLSIFNLKALIWEKKDYKNKIKNKIRIKINLNIEVKINS